MHLELGNIEEAYAHAQHALTLAEKNNETYYYALTLPLMGRILARSGRAPIAEAEETALRGINLLDSLNVQQQVAIALLCLADIYVCRHSIERATGSLKKAETIFKDARAEYWLAKTRGFLSLLGS